MDDMYLFFRTIGKKGTYRECRGFLYVILKSSVKNLSKKSKNLC